MIKRLLKLADELDSIELEAEADEVSSLIKESQSASVLVGWKHVGKSTDQYGTWYHLKDPKGGKPKKFLVDEWIPRSMAGGEPMVRGYLSKDKDMFAWIPWIQRS